MSAESYEWLNGGNILVGNTLVQGLPWWNKPELQPVEPIFFDGPIPVEVINTRLFNFEVVESAIYYQVPSADGLSLEYKCDDTRKVMYRSDNHKVLGAFKEGYQGHGYKEWLLETVALILDDELGVNSTGLLRSGGVAWVQVGVPTYFTTPSGVQFSPFILASTSFDGTHATQFNRCSKNAICDNTMGVARSQGGDQRIKIKHTRNSGVKLLEAREALALVHSMVDDITERVEKLTNVTVSDTQWGEIVNALAPIPEDEGRGKTQATTKQGELSRLYNYDSRVAPWRSTAYGVVQCVNTYAHHSAITRGHDGMTGDDLRAMRNAEKMVSGYFDDLDLATLELMRPIVPDLASALA